MEICSFQKSFRDKFLLSFFLFINNDLQIKRKEAREIVEDLLERDKEKRAEKGRKMMSSSFFVGIDWEKLANMDLLPSFTEPQINFN